MDVKISQDVLEAYFDCKYKSQLNCSGQQGVRSEYEGLFDELRERVRLQAIDQESRKNSGNDEIRDAPLTSLTRRGQHELSLREERGKKILRCRTEQSQCTHTGTL